VDSDENCGKYGVQQEYTNAWNASSFGTATPPPPEGHVGWINGQAYQLSPYPGLRPLAEGVGLSALASPNQSPSTPSTEKSQHARADDAYRSIRAHTPPPSETSRGDSSVFNNQRNSHYQAHQSCVGDVAKAKARNDAETATSEIVLGLAKDGFMTGTPLSPSQINARLSIDATVRLIKAILYKLHSQGKVTFYKVVAKADPETVTVMWSALASDLAPVSVVTDSGVEAFATPIAVGENLPQPNVPSGERVQQNKRGPTRHGGRNGGNSGRQDRELGKKGVHLSPASAAKG
jgi:hypothetical protein